MQHSGPWLKLSHKWASLAVSAPFFLPFSHGFCYRTTSVLYSNRGQGYYYLRDQGLHSSLHKQYSTARIVMGGCQGSEEVKKGTQEKEIIYSDHFSERMEKFRQQVRESQGKELVVFIDFDLTLTEPNSEQCHHMFGSSPAVPAALRETMGRYLRMEVPLPSHYAWWEAVHAEMAAAGLTRGAVRRAARGARAPLRPGAAAFLRRLEARGVPVVVVSAGLADVVEEVLAAHDALRPNVRVVSNRMVFAAAGSGSGTTCVGDKGKGGGMLQEEEALLVGFEELPFVTSRNKEVALARAFPPAPAEAEGGTAAAAALRPRRRRRYQALAVGDKPGDALFLRQAGPAWARAFGYGDEEEGEEEEEGVGVGAGAGAGAALCVGFRDPASAYHSEEAYRAAFDAVLEGPGHTFAPLLALVEAVLPPLEEGEEGCCGPSAAAAVGDFGFLCGGGEEGVPPQEEEEAAMAS